MDPFTYIIAGAVGYGIANRVYSWYSSEDKQPDIPEELLSDIRNKNATLKPVVDEELASILSRRRKMIAGESK